MKESILLASEYSDNVTNMETIRAEIESVLETQFTTAKALKVRKYEIYFSHKIGLCKLVYKTREKEWLGGSSIER